jgi:hypothetical protein
VGRFVRARRAGETASVFLPSVPPLLALAGELEAERDHVLGRPARDGGWDDAALAAANRPAGKQGEQDPGFEVLGASAHLDQVIFDGASFGTGATPGTPEEEEYLGLPGLLEPDQVALLLRQRQARQLAEQRRQASAQPGGPQPAGPGTAQRAAQPATAYERRAALRRELNALVAAYHHRSGQPHGSVHAELRRACGGPPTATATIEQLERRIATLRSW